MNPLMLSIWVSAQQNQRGMPVERSIGRKTGAGEERKNGEGAGGLDAMEEHKADVLVVN